MLLCGRKTESVNTRAVTSSRELGLILCSKRLRVTYVSNVFPGSKVRVVTYSCIEKQLILAITNMNSLDCK